jgi:hypothetical protein
MPFEWDPPLSSRTAVGPSIHPFVATCQVGHPLSALVADPEPVKALLGLCNAAADDDLAEGTVTAELLLNHRYGTPFAVQVTVRPAGRHVGCVAVARRGAGRAMLGCSTALG